MTAIELQSDSCVLPLTDEELLAECEVETFRSGGKGGQHVNTTDSAVRLRHKPTGIVAISQAGRSQHRNKATALQNLRRKIERHTYRPPPRLPTRATKASKRRTLDAKNANSEKKRLRAKPRVGDE